MIRQEDSDFIVGTYVMYTEQGMDQILQAMGYNHPSRMVIMSGTKYMKVEKKGDYWQITECVKNFNFKECFCLKFRSGKKFSWTARNGSKVKSLVTRMGNKFEFRHEPSDLEEYKILYGETEFFEDGDVVMKMKVEGLDEFEAVYRYKNYK